MGNEIQAWLQVVGRVSYGTVYASEAEARRHEPYFFEDVEWDVLLDSPTADVVFSSKMDLFGFPGFLSRDHWIERYSEFKSHFGEPLPVELIAWDESSERTFRSHFESHYPMKQNFFSTDPRMGPAPLPAGEEWPVCDECSEDMHFIGVLDVRKTVGKSLVMHVCADCHAGGDAYAVHWISPQDEIEIHRVDSQKFAIGTHYATTDYPRIEIPRRVSASRPEFEEQDYYYILNADCCKVGGYPWWFDEDESYTDCRFLGQTVPWGDSGRVYAFLDESAPDALNDASASVILEFQMD